VNQRESAYRYHLRVIWHRGNIDLVIDLAAIRRTAGMTQEQLADRLQLRQSQISRTEHQADVLVSTLVAYIRALGADAELAVRMPGGETIHQILTDRVKDRH
jgi:transcriptional regulator with XRE-family HTH domain